MFHPTAARSVAPRFLAARLCYDEASADRKIVIPRPVLTLVVGIRNILCVNRTKGMCLRRHTFCQQQQKVCKKCRQKPMVSGLPFACKSCILSPAETGNGRISTHAAATRSVEEICHFPAVDPHAPLPEWERQRVCCTVHSLHIPYRTKLLRIEEVLKPKVSSGVLW